MHAERLGHAGDAAESPLLDVGDQPVDRIAIVLFRGRDRQADRVQLDARLGDLGDELVGARLVGIGHDLVEVVHTENRDDRVDAHGQVGKLSRRSSRATQGVLEFLEVAHNAADEVMFLAQAVERQIDDELALGARPAIRRTLSGIEGRMLLVGMLMIPGRQCS